MTITSKEPVYQIQVTGGSVTVSPFIHIANRGAPVRWIINNATATAKVVFRDSSVMGSFDDTATMKDPASGEAAALGNFPHSIVVWQDETSEPITVGAILIVE